ncbi:MAG: hypothetical protein K0S76_167 [Herbinix sp.]|jgi:predicted site-specific integrase-resolvase|nr:hypothetical protein [Herbinix sp.]
MAQYTDITEISRLTGISVTTLRRGAHSGRFPHIRLNNIPRGKLLFDLQAVEQVLGTEAQASMHSKEEAKK